MEHLGGKTKCMVGHVYHEAYNKSSVLLGPCHKLSVQLEQVIQLHPKTKTVENFSMAKLTATIMKMYGIRKPLRKKMHQHRPQQPQQNYMKGTNYMKSVANFYRSTTTNSSVGHKSTKQTPRRPASARRSRRSNGQTSRSNRFNQSSQQSPPQSSPQSPPQDVQDVQDVQSNQELSKNMTVHVMQVEQEKKKRKNCSSHLRGISSRTLPTRWRSASSTPTRPCANLQSTLVSATTRSPICSVSNGTWGPTNTPTTTGSDLGVSTYPTTKTTTE